MTHLQNWIQAIAAAALVILTWKSLLVLRGYAKDTRTIADKSVEQIVISIQQTENAQKPFLALASREANVAQHTAGGWVIENQGAGAALNVQHTDHQGGDAMRSIPPMAKGDCYVLTNYDREAIERRGFEVRYESLGGMAYTTVVTWTNGVMQTKFRTASGPVPLRGESRTSD